MTDRASIRRVTTALCVAVLACAAAASLIAPLYGWPAFLPAGLAALAAGAVTGSLWRRRTGARRRAWFVAAIVFDVLLGAVVAVPDEAAGGTLPTIAGLIGFAGACVAGWRDVLTAATPLGGGDGLLVPGYLVVLLGTAWATAGGRRAAIGPLLIALFAAAFGVRGATPTPAVAAAVVSGVLLLLGVLAVAAVNVAAARIRARSLLLPVGVLVVCAVIGSGAAAVIPLGPDRVVPRELVEPPIDAAALASPLSAFRRWFGSDTAETVLFTAADVAAGTRFTLARLDDYDGVVLGPRSAPDFRRLPAGGGGAGAARITIVALDEPWVPLPLGAGVPTLGADGVSAYYSATDGTALTVPSLGAGATVNVVAGSAVRLDPDELGPLTPGAATMLRSSADSDLVDEYFDGAAVGSDRPGVRLASALDAMLATGYLSHGAETGGAPSRPGHSLGRLEEMLTTEPMVGDGEQYASAAALFADRAGFPARVGVGFDAESATDAKAVVRGRDAVAWLEVFTAERGWVVVDVTPHRSDAPQRLPDAAVPTARPQAVVEPPVPQQKSDAAGNQEGTDVDPAPPDRGAALPTWVVAGALALALVLLPPALIIGIKAFRRRRRLRARDPRARLLGAWSDYLDAATDRGVAPPPGGNRLDIARALMDPRALTLARLADRAAFDPLPIPSEEPERVWAALPQLRRGLRPGAPLRLRVRWALSLASIRRPARRYHSQRKGRTL
ncbi:transglutaminase domain-containing protein [Microbacteriaceae bacterium VKM Ac-2854]|nr:transglutaminase domain-containing protein [Microbacteriaceae bacterium VKM Ac-2854]